MEKQSQSYEELQQSRIDYVLELKQEEENQINVQQTLFKDKYGRTRERLMFKTPTQQLLKNQLSFSARIMEGKIKKGNQKKYCKFIEIGCTFIQLFILLFFYYVVIYSKVYPSEDFYDQFIFNQNQGIIDEIIIVNASFQCPQDHEPIFNYQWPGIFEGCDCTQNLTIEEMNDDALFQKNFKRQKQCNEVELGKGCKSISEIKEKQLSQLNDNNYSKPFLICAKRSQNVSLRYNFTYCQQQNKIICGTDSFSYCLPCENNTCSSKDNQCPITEIGFTSNPNQFNLNKINDPKVGKIFNVSNHLSFYYTRNQSQIPISQIQITETPAICRLNSQQNISPNRSDYYLMKTQRKPCEQNDTQFKIVQRFNEEQFYLANNLLYLNRSLSYFEVRKDVEWTLQTKSYAQINENCQYGSEEHTSEYENFLQKKHIKDIRESMRISQFLMIPILFIMINFFPNIFENEKSHVPRCRWLVIYTLRIVRIFIPITILILVAILLAGVSNSKNNFMGFLKSQCIITELASNIYDFDQLDFSWGETILTIFVGIILPICAILFYCFKFLARPSYLRKGPNNDDKSSQENNCLKNILNLRNSLKIAPLEQRNQEEEQPQVNNQQQNGNQ